MKAKRIVVLLIAVISVVTAAFALFACGEGGSPSDNTYTVSFDTDGANEIASVEVADGKTVAEPAEPQKDGYVFKGWYNGDDKYDFDTPVKSDLTLKAHWNELYTVKFMSDGAEFKSKTVEKGSTVSPSDIPSKVTYIFMYWSESEDPDGTPYDFDAPVTKNVVLYAKWMKESDAFGVLQSAISAQNFTTYPYTAKFNVSEVSGGERIEYTITYKYVQNAEGGHDVYSVFDSSWNTEERYTVFGSDGAELSRYYKGKNADAYTASSSVWTYDYYMPFKFYDMSADAATGDFNCVDGAFVEDGAYVFGVYAESTPMFEMNVIGTYNELLVNAQVAVKDGKIASVKGDMNGGVEYVIDFDYTPFEQQRPELPDSEVVARKVKDGSGLVGEPIAASALTSLFELKVNGATVAVKENMLDIGELDMQNPVGGTYPIKLEYTSWDGVNAQADATFTVAEQTLKDVLDYEYLNAAFTVGSTTIRRNGDVYFYEKGSFDYYLKTDDSSKGYKTAKMAKITKAVTLNQWVRCVRIDLLLGLDADLFEYDGSAKTYTFKSVYDTTEPYMTKLKNFLALTAESNITNSLKLNDQAKPYSIVLTADENNKIVKINVSFYTTTKQFTFEFAVTADAAPVETPPEIVNAFTKYTVTYKAGDRAEGEDYEVTVNGGSYAVLSYSDYASFGWTVQSGWKFVNWKIEGTETCVNGGTSHDLNTPNSPSITFVAQWEEMQKYTVTYRAGEHGTGADVVKNDVNEGAYTVESPDALSIAAVDGYVFGGWLVEGTANVVGAGKYYTLGSDVVFVAQWKQKVAVYTPADSAQQANYYNSSLSQYAYIVQAEINLNTMQIELTYTVDGTTQTEIVDLKEDKYYGKDYELSTDGELKNYFGEGAYITLSADGSSLQFYVYDYYEGAAVETGKAYTKQA